MDLSDFLKKLSDTALAYANSNSDTEVDLTPVNDEKTLLTSLAMPLS